jgi:hypothetical protein
MKKRIGISMVGLIVLGVFAMGVFIVPGYDTAAACNWGTPGGQGYAPQRRLPQDGTAFGAPSMTKEQAHDLIARHVKKLNPDLVIGPIKDAGNYYAADIMTKDEKIVERLIVDKQTGSLIAEF